ncbi:MAG: glycosyltransferase, partial [Acidobacteriota bacterium]
MSDPPRSAPPVVSVIVPTLGRSPLLQAGLEALRADDGPRRELLLVAPRGVDLGGVEDLADRVLRLGGLPGFTVANNRALEVARGRFVALVNDDAVIQRGWLAALVAALRVRPDVAGVQGVNVRLDGEGKGGPTARIDGWGLGWNR